MNVSSIGIQTKNIDDMIVILKQGLPYRHILHHRGAHTVTR